MKTKNLKTKNENNYESEPKQNEKEEKMNGTGFTIFSDRFPAEEAVWI